MATATNKTSTSNFSSSVVDAYIRKRVLAHGQSNYLFRKNASKDPIPAGNGDNIKFIRYERLVLPSTLTEGTTPSSDSLEINTVTGQATQYGQVVSISDVLELQMWHPVVTHAMEELAEGAARKDDQIIQEALLGATTVSYGGGAADRTALGASDTLDTELLRDVIATLEVGSDGVDGGAKPFMNGFMKGILHRKHELDLMDDTVWSSMAVRQDAQALERGRIRRWNGVEFEVTNFGPQFNSLSAAPTGWNVADNASGTLYDNAAVLDVGFVRKHKKRGFAEDMYFTTHTMSANKDLDITTPTSTDYTYDIYADSAADGSGSAALVASDVAGGVTTTVSSLPTTAAPDAPATAAGNIYTSYIFGADSYSVVDLDSLKTYTTRGADSNDPLDQVRTMGVKWYDAALILNNAFIVRIEAPSSH